MRKRSLLLSVALGLLILSSQTMAQSDQLHLAAYHGKEQQVIALLAENPDPDARDSYGGTALHAAMFQDNLNIVRLLIKAGFDVNAIGPRNGYTPLHDAVWADNLPALQLLISQGGDLTIQGKDGLTPLAKAQKEGKSAIANYLASLSQ